MILITGAKGQLGHCFQELAPNFPTHEFCFTDYEELDITKKSAVFAFFKAVKPDWIINCAAYTAVDKAETELALSRKINSLGAKNLALAAAEMGVPMIHYSTDYVYHSNQNTPFKEGDRVSPKGVYAKTKLEGDNAVLKANPLTMVLRTSWVYSPFGNNFVKTMMRLGSERSEMRVVADQVGSPTYAPDLAAATLEIIKKVESGELEKSKIAGVWHYSNEGVCCWADFAAAIFEIKGIACQVAHIETKDYPTPAQRPPFSLMSKEKVKRELGLKIPHWRDSLKVCLSRL